jgi:hypothetical protein
VTTFLFGVALELLGDSSIALRLVVAFVVAVVGFVVSRVILRRREEAVDPPSGPNLALYRSEALDELIGQAKKLRSGTSIGWPHFLDPSGAHAHPSVLGTAYGLKLLMLLDPDCHRLDHGSPAETLLSFQKRDGGWASSSQGSHSRPESTALVLSALAPLLSQDERFRRAISRLRELVEAPDAESRLDLTAVATIVLLFASSQRDLRDISQSLCERLCRGRELLAGPGTTYWPARMGRGQEPSVAHTARAIVAIERHLRTHDDPLGREAVREGRQWLVQTVNNSPEPSLRFVEEVVRRDGVAGLLHLRHFTPAWVLRALPMNGELALRAQRVRFVAREQTVRYRTGWLWRWPGGGEEPIWMTYQALKALESGG